MQRIMRMLRICSERLEGSSRESPGEFFGNCTPVGIGGPRRGGKCVNLSNTCGTCYRLLPPSHHLSQMHAAFVRRIVGTRSSAEQRHDDSDDER